MTKKTQVIYFLIVVCLCLFLGGCAQKEAGPEVVVNRFLQSIQNKDYLSAFSYVRNETSLSEENLPSGISLKTWKALADALVEKTNYEVPQVISISDQEAIVQVTFQTVDCAKVYQELEGRQSGGFQALLQGFQEALRKEAVPTITLVVPFTLIKLGDNWRIVLDDSLINALTGNLLETLKEADLI